MPEFKDYNVVSDRLVLPVNGKQYTIPDVTVAGRKRFEASQADDKNPVSDDEFEHIFMGDVLEQMRADDVPDKVLDRALATAFAFATQGVGLAEIYWETGGDPKALRSYVSAKLSASQPSTSTGEASTTPSPKRGSGTKPRQK